MKKIPFDFVVEALERVNPRLNPMFGCHAVYVGEKIVLILRQRVDYESDNGVWVATIPEHHASLKKDFPSMRSIGLFGEKVTSWQNLPLDSNDFEESALKACEYILKNDPRIGKIPKAKAKRPRSRK